MGSCAASTSGWGRGEAKVVRCSAGAVFDVVVDLRPDSPEFGRWLSFDLDGDTQRSVHIPAGSSHGFQALTDPSDTSYRIDREHDPAEDLTIAHDDPTLAIPWPLEVTAMSDAHARAAPALRARHGSRDASRRRSHDPRTPPVHHRSRDRTAGCLGLGRRGGTCLKGTVMLGPLVGCRAVHAGSVSPPASWG